MSLFSRHIRQVSLLWSDLLFRIRRDADGSVRAFLFSGFLFQFSQAFFDFGPRACHASFLEDEPAFLIFLHGAEEHHEPTIVAAGESLRNAFHGEVVRQCMAYRPAGLRIDCRRGVFIQVDRAEISLVSANDDPALSFRNLSELFPFRSFQAVKTQDVDPPLPVAFLSLIDEADDAMFERLLESQLFFEHFSVVPNVGDLLFYSTDILYRRLFRSLHHVFLHGIELKPEPLSG